MASPPPPITLPPPTKSGGSSSSSHTKKPPKPPKTPQQQALRSVAVAAARQALTDPYVTVRNGKLVPVKNPKQAVRYFGQPLTRSQFLSQWRSINDLYLTFTGKEAGPGAVAQILRQGLSTYQLKTQLSKRKDFVGSPLWKQMAPGYQSVWSSIYGPDAKPDDAAIRYAIINNLGAGGFAERLRQRADYTSSNEFAQKTSSLSAVYTKIFGVPDANGENVIKQAALTGWDENQFALYLRHQPQYSQSQEYQARALGLAQDLGLVFGNVPTMAPGQAPANPNEGGPGLPNDPRAPQASQPNPTSGLVVNP